MKSREKRNRGEVITITVSTDEKEKVFKYAFDADMSVCAYVRKAIFKNTKEDEK